MFVDTNSKITGKMLAMLQRVDNFMSHRDLAHVLLLDLVISYCLTLGTHDLPCSKFYSLLTMTRMLPENSGAHLFSLYAPLACFLLV